MPLLVVAAVFICIVYPHKGLKRKRNMQRVLIGAKFLPFPLDLLSFFSTATNVDMHVRVIQTSSCIEEPDFWGVVASSLKSTKDRKGGRGGGTRNKQRPKG